MFNLEYTEMLQPSKINDKRAITYVFWTAKEEDEIIHHNIVIKKNVYEVSIYN